MITQEYLKSILHYDPETGIFTWINSKRDGWNGKEAGTTTKTRVHIQILNRLYLSHRLAFLYMTGSMPKMVDHINEIPLDNRWCNLRECTRSQNVANITEKRSDNKSGYRGVYRRKKSRKYIAQVRKNGKVHHLGTFKTPEEAYEAYKKAHSELFGEFSPFG